MRNLFTKFDIKKYNYKINVGLNYETFVGVLSLLISWYFNKSILWGILHYLCGVYYLVYCIISRAFSNGELLKIFNYYF